MIDIKKVRRKHNLSQEVMAKMLGCTQAAISRWENGKAKPSARLLMEIIQIFNVKITKKAVRGQ